MKIVQKAVAVILSAAMFVGLYFACMHYAVNIRTFYVDSPGTTNSSLDFKVTSMDRLIENYVNTGLERNITISGVGDIMFHEWQLERAYSQSTQTFDFSDSFTYMADALEASDLLIGNLETTIAGKSQGKYENFYGYGANLNDNNFNSPEAAVQNLVDVGFDVLSTANEHALDSGTQGLLSTLTNISNTDMTAIGTKAASEDPDYVMTDVSGMKVGLIAATNVLTTAADETNQGLIQTLDGYNEDKVQSLCADIQQMRSEGAQAVIAVIHFGELYQEDADDQQKNLAHQLIKAGADVIFGSHPHTLEPIEIYPVTEEDGTSRNGVIIYSMGNFLSSQQYKGGTGNRDIGGLFDIVFGKQGDQVRIKEIHVTPTYVNWTDDAIAVVPVCEAHDAPETFGDIFDSQAQARIDAAYETVIPQILERSGVQYTYSDYKYKIVVENS